MSEATTAFVGFAQGKQVAWTRRTRENNQPGTNSNRRRRDSKAFYYYRINKNSQCSPRPRNAPISSSAKINQISNTDFGTGCDFEISPSRSLGQNQGYGQGQPSRATEDSFNPENAQIHVAYFDAARPPYDMENFDLNTFAQDHRRQAGSIPTWQSSQISNTLVSGSLASPNMHRNDNDNAPLSHSQEFYVHISNEIGGSWNDADPSGNHNDILWSDPALDVSCEGFEILESLPGSSPASTGSDGFVFPAMTSSMEQPPGADPSFELDFSDEYFHVGQPFDLSSSYQPNPNSIYQDNFLFNNELQVPVDLDFSSNYLLTDSLWSNQPNIPQSYCPTLVPPIISQPPWNPGLLSRSIFETDLGATDSAYKQQDIIPSKVSTTNEGYSEIDGTRTGFICQEITAAPSAESDNESWTIPFDLKNSTPTHSSASSQKSVRSQSSSPRQNDERHPHVFSTSSGITKRKISKGRQRNLTQQEKKQAREVREAKACWACHISKTKCSPCSPGSPCEQCTRLIGKRRFCKFDCFNDPLESLYTFLVPDYLMGHFTQQNVEAFVARNASSWGTQKLFVRMAWGYRKLLEAEVVALELRSDAQEMQYEESSRKNKFAQKVMVRRNSPPLGIPFRAMDDIHDVYSRYVQDIVRTDLEHYYPTAYLPKDPGLVKRLLKVVGTFYQEGLEDGHESDILREAIELHVTSVILQNSLKLDHASKQRIQDHLQQEYPENPVARCAQRQIKLVFFNTQQKRIRQVLKEYGNMMWTLGTGNGNENKWAISFCVWLMLTLVMDKLNKAARLLCASEIKFHGGDALSERTKCEELVRMMDTKLFERGKEIFHWKFKTRKGGKEACNPIRDGMDAFRGKPVSRGISHLTLGLQAIVREYGQEIRSHQSQPGDPNSQTGGQFTDLGRLACIFLDDFLDH